MESWVQFVVGPIAVLIVGWVLDRRFKKVGANVEATRDVTHAVREQVQNSHETNLRDDLDAIRDLIAGHLRESEKDRTRLAVIEAIVRQHLDRPRKRVWPF